MADSDSSGCGWALFALILVGVCFGSKDEPTTQQIQQGDLSIQGGSPTIRKEFSASEDDPFTSDDESNDQPVGYFGTKTLLISGESGNTYTLDGEIEGSELRRVYFPRGGWVDFIGCELESDLSGLCFDEEGRSWTIFGESYGRSEIDVDEEAQAADSYGFEPDGDEDEVQSDDESYQ